MQDKFRELDTFLRVAAVLNFSEAARELDCDPSTVSRVIGRLENRLGARLFHRTSRLLRLTQDGKRFFEGARQVAVSIEAAEEMVSGADVRGGTLRVGVTRAFAESQLVPIIVDYLDRYPRIKLELLMSPAPLDLVENQVDVAVVAGAIEDSTIVATRISSSRWTICASPAYIKRAGVPRTLDELGGHNCLNLFPGHKDFWRLADRRQTLQGNASTNSSDMLRLLALSGLGIVRLPDFHVGQDIAAGRLVALPIEEGPAQPPDPVYVVYSSKRNLSRRISTFIDFLRERLGRRDPWGLTK